MTHQVYLPDDVWGEVKEFLIPPKKPEKPHPIVENFDSILLTERMSHPCCLFFYDLTLDVKDKRQKWTELEEE